MITIKGKARKIPKGNHKCPNDGIHRKKSSGRIRGFWGAKVGSSHLVYGNWAYYTEGLKVFYSFKFNKTTKTLKEAEVTADMMCQLKDFCPAVYGTEKIATDITFKKRRCVGVSPALRMQHVFYPEKAWLNFAKGKSYDWGADSHPAHSKVGFEMFRTRLTHATDKIDYNFDSFSIGNIVWCTVEKRWYLVDVR